MTNETSKNGWDINTDNDTNTDDHDANEDEQQQVLVPGKS